MIRLAWCSVTVLAGMLFLTGCEEDVTATAVPPSHGLLAAGAYGLLNTPHMKLGDIVAINRSRDKEGNKQVYRLRSLDAVVVKAHTQAPNAFGDITTGFSRQLDIGFSASLETKIDLAFKLLISSATEMKIINTKRVQLDSVIDSLTADQVAVTEIARHPNRDQLYFFVVQALINGDTFDLGIRKDLQSETNVNVFKYGNYKLSVNYTNKEWTTVTANGNALFFKLTPIALDKNGTPFVDTSVDVSPEDYDWTETVMKKG